MENKCFKIILSMSVIWFIINYFNYYPFVPYISSISLLIILMYILKSPKNEFDELDIICTKIGYQVYKNKSIDTKNGFSYIIKSGERKKKSISWIVNNWDIIIKYIPELKRKDYILFIDDERTSNVNKTINKNEENEKVIEDSEALKESSEKLKDGFNDSFDGFCNLCGSDINVSDKKCNNCMNTL